MRSNVASLARPCPAPGASHTRWAPLPLAVVAAARHRD